MTFLVFCCNPTPLTKGEIFRCLSIIQCDWKQLNVNGVKMIPTEILQAVQSKNNSFVYLKISVEQLTRLLDYINNKLPRKEKFFTPDNLKEVWTILGIKPI